MTLFTHTKGLSIRMAGGSRKPLPSGPLVALSMCTKGSLLPCKREEPLQEQQGKPWVGAPSVLHTISILLLPFQCLVLRFIKPNHACISSREADVAEPTLGQVPTQPYPKLGRWWAQE